MSNHSKVFKQSVVEFYCAAITVPECWRRVRIYYSSDEARGLPV
ncbi:hypothetical protein [Sinorhizobium medicae]